MFSPSIQSRLVCFLCLFLRNVFGIQLGHCSGLPSSIPPPLFVIIHPVIRLTFLLLNGPSIAWQLRSFSPPVSSQSDTWLGPDCEVINRHKVSITCSFLMCSAGVFDLCFRLLNLASFPQFISPAFTPFPASFSGCFL